MTEQEIQEALDYADYCHRNSKVYKILAAAYRQKCEECEKLKAFAIEFRDRWIDKVDYVHPNNYPESFEKFEEFIK